MAKDKAAWTVMVYLAGDNNLSEECVYGLTEMKKANCDKKQINVIAQFDSADDFIPTRRYEVNQIGVEGPLADDIIGKAFYDPKINEVHFAKESQNASHLADERFKDRAAQSKVALNAKDSRTAINVPPAPDPSRGGFDDTDTASRITLYNFLSYCIQEYPAYHYMVVLSGHGAGTERDYFLKDEGSGGYLTFNELKLAFEQVKQNDLNGQKIDIIGLDSCLMSMAEVCYELRNLAQIVVGCESYAPAAGWPYRSILEKLKELLNDEAAGDLAARFARSIVENYVGFYRDYTEGGSSVTQSALDLSQILELKAKIKSLVDTLAPELTREDEREKARPENEEKTYPFRDALILAHWESQSYNGESYVDIVDFCRCLARRYQGGDVSQQCQDVVDFITGQFVIRSCFNGSVYQYSYGVSIYFPWSTVAPYYLNLDFAKDSSWAEFLATYTDLTRRAPRRPIASSGASAGDFTSLVESNAAISTAEFKMGSGETGSGRMGSGRMGSGRMGSGRMGSGRMGSGRMGSGRMGSGRETNPIHSMRNPPIEVASFDWKPD